MKEIDKERLLVFLIVDVTEPHPTVYGRRELKGKYKTLGYTQAEPMLRDALGLEDER